MPVVPQYWTDLPMSMTVDTRKAWFRYLRQNEAARQSYDSQMYWQKDSERRRAKKARRERERDAE